MTDYHDNETEYTYTDRNQLSTLASRQSMASRLWLHHLSKLDHLRVAAEGDGEQINAANR